MYSHIVGCITILSSMFCPVDLDVAVVRLVPCPLSEACLPPVEMAGFTAGANIAGTRNVSTVKRCHNY